MPIIAGRIPDWKSHKISEIMVRNDGIVFRDQDWTRLKTIASGNPDESKIGAFVSSLWFGVRARDFGVDDFNLGRGILFTLLIMR